jgi:hypothetical protein
MLNGYWVHFAPRGYKYADCPTGGRVLVRDEPLATIIADGLERYASGAFGLKAELMRYWQKFPEFPKGDCGKPMTGCYSKGRTNTYRYYYCFSKGCNAFSKSIRREDLEAQFENILGSLTPSPALHGVVNKMVKTWWSYRHEQLSARTLSCRREARRLSEKIEQAMDRLLEKPLTHSKTVTWCLSSPSRKV